MYLVESIESIKRVPAGAMSTSMSDTIYMTKFMRDRMRADRPTVKGA